jgi:GntR family transcriptional regulator of vanillate catabolism
MTDAADATSMLRERIMSGELAPRARLQQIPLSEALGISRTPLREALATLAREGLLDYEPNRGYAVRSFDWAEVEQAYAVRARLEAFACHLCARHGLAAERIQKLEACLRAGDAVLRKGRLLAQDLPTYRAMNVEFHETIIGAAKNVWIGRFVRQTQNVPLASDRLFIWEDFDVIKRSHDDHHRIVHAIKQGDAERAEALMREHIIFAGEVLKAIKGGPPKDC